LNKTGLKKLQAWWKEEHRYSSGGEGHTLINDGRFGIYADTQHSYGYVYIRAWIKKEVTANEEILR
jgi:hypothetical protein